MKVDRVMVVGAGTMGCGISQVLAESGLEVLLYDTDRAAVEKGTGNIGARLQKKVEKGELRPEEKTGILGRIRQAESLAESSRADFVIEAVVEDLETKRQVFAELDRACPARNILATNTSALSISEIAGATGHPERTIGMHFFNPVPVMKLVEVVKGKKTSAEAVTATKALAVRIGKTPVEVNESPGFIVNRLLIPMINEAIYLLSEGVAGKEDIDTAMKSGAGHPMGPLALADLIGLDVCLAIMETLEKELGNFRVCPLLRSMVKEGKLGRKTGEGFYSYSK